MSNINLRINRYNKQVGIYDTDCPARCPDHTACHLQNSKTTKWSFWPFSDYFLKPEYIIKFIDILILHIMEPSKFAGFNYFLSYEQKSFQNNLDHKKQNGHFDHFLTVFSNQCI